MRRYASLLLILCVVVATGGVPSVAASTSDAHSATGTAAPAPNAEQAPENDTTDATAASEDATTVTLLSYNDIQTAAVQDGTYPRMVNLIDERRAAHDNPTVVVGGGDQVSPHSLSPLSEWRVPVDTLNVLQPDAEVIGNHDLDFGFDAVSEFGEASEFPWLMANIVDSETGEPIPGTEPYTVVERDGAKVGVIGLADEAIKSKTAVSFDKQGYELRNYSDVASEYATQLKEEENVDVVVAAAHVGIPESETLARTTDDVDAIVVGDDEVEYPPQETSGTVITEAEARGEHVSEINFTVEDGEVTAWDGRLLDVTDETPKNETVSTIIDDARSAELDKVAGRTEVELDARFTPNYHEETALGNMIGDSFRAQTGADVAITNAGGIRSNAIYGPGNVTVGDVYNILPFQNTLTTVELTGAEIEQLLASQVVTLESETGQNYGPEAQLQVSGVTYEYVGHEGEEYIRDAWINGEPLDEDETYNVTVNSYMAGWDGSVLEDAPRVSKSNVLYGTALLEYIQDNSPVAPEGEDRIRRIDTETAVESVSVRAGTATVELDAPNGTTNVVADSYYATRGDSGERLEAESVELDGDTVTVSFANAEYRQLAGEGGALQIYGEYDTTAYDRVFYDHSVLNANVEASDSGEKKGHEKGNDGNDDEQNSLASIAGASATPAAI